MRKSVTCLLPALLAGTALAGSAGTTVPPAKIGKVQPSVVPTGTGSGMQAADDSFRPTPTDGILKKMLAGERTNLDGKLRPLNTAGMTEGGNKVAKRELDPRTATNPAGADGNNDQPQRGGAVKYDQPIDCASGCGAFFSTLNNDYNQFVRVDDFICTQTGNIEAVQFWGGCWDFYFFTGCDILTSDLQGFVVEIYEAVDGGACGWEIGEFLCGYQYTVSQLNPVFECFGSFSEQHYRLTADLNPPCFQEEGKHYTLYIAGISNTGSPQGFAWGSSAHSDPLPGFSILGGLGGDRFCTGCEEAFSLLTTPTPCDGLGDPNAKWSQPPNCENFCYFSNLNSNLNPFLRADDFICNLSGPITDVTFWATCWDLNAFTGCPLPGSNVQAINIQINEFIEDPVCGWRPGDVVCSETIPVDRLDPQFFCTGPGGEQYYRLNAKLGSACIQEEGRHYVIQIAGVLRDPNNPQILCWAQTCQSRLCVAVSTDRNTGECLVLPEDNAFELFTPNPQKWCQEPACANPVCCWFSTENNNVNPYIQFDDFTCTRTGGVTEIHFWGGAYDVFFGAIDLLFSDIDGFVIEIYEFVDGGGICGWAPGEILCRGFYTLAELNPTFECFDNCGIPHYAMTAKLAEPWFQDEGTRYSIKIAAVTRNPDSGHLGCLLPTGGQVDAVRFSFDRFNGAGFELCSAPDASFCIITPIGGCDDCDGDGICDADENDCNQNGIPDECDPNHCAADLAPPFGVLNVFDFLAFQTAFGNNEPCADLAPPFGVWNVFDFLAYQTAFGNGC